MFAVGNDFRIFLCAVTTLQTMDEIQNVLSDVERIFSGRLLPTAPSGILERINIRCEEIETSETVVIESASFCANNGCCIVD